MDTKTPVEPSNTTSVCGNYHENSSLVWGKSLTDLPIFTGQDIDEYQKKRASIYAKTHSKIAKPIHRGSHFQQDKFISKDTIQTATDDNFFYVRASCCASTKKDVRHMSLCLHKKNGSVQHAFCDCPAGTGGLDNHSTALMLEVAMFSLNNLEVVPAEESPTSLRCKWIGPKRNENVDKPSVMEMEIRKYKVDDMTSSRLPGVKCTLYEARKQRIMDPFILSQFLSSLQEENPRIGLADVAVVGTERQEFVSTRYGPAHVGSVLSYQLALSEDNYKVYISPRTTPHNMYNDRSEKYPQFPLNQVPFDHDASGISEVDSPVQLGILQDLEVSAEECNNIEQCTQEQQSSNDWMKHRLNRLTASQFGRVYDRVRSFDSLANNFYDEKSGKVKPNRFVQEKLDYGIVHESIAVDKYKTYMDRYGYPVIVDKCGLVVNPSLYWLGASTDRKVTDYSEISSFGIVEVKCPETRKNQDLCVAATDKKFYLEMVDGKPRLKKWHMYYCQVLGQMALTGAKWCDFVCYTSVSLVVDRIYYREEDWNELYEKIDRFYFSHYLPMLESKV